MTKTYQAMKLFIVMLIAILLNPSALSAPGVLAKLPLMTSAQMAPNIMFLVDSSNSMNNIAVDEPYDAATTYFNCPSSLQLSTRSPISIYITKEGLAYYRNSFYYYDWGVTAGFGHTQHIKRCFNPNATYSAQLYANNGFNTQYASGYGGVSYSGNYLNWYFGSSPRTWGKGARKKPTTNRRHDIAQLDVLSLLDTLTETRVGYASFDTDKGAYIRVGMDEITTNKPKIEAEFKQVIPDSWTPLAEALHDMGRYFIGEGYNPLLTLHPQQSNETSKSANTVFNHSPRYANGVSRSSPIQAFCQRNFLLLITDGQSAEDRNIKDSTGLTDYDGDCVNANPSCLSYDRKSNRSYGYNGSDYLDDIALSLFEMDLRPDLKDSYGQPVKVNLRTYTVGFSEGTVLNDPLLKATAAQGGGLFFAANNAAQLATAFKQAIDDIRAHSGMSVARTLASGAAFNTNNLTGNSEMYLASFNTSGWQGDVVQLPVNALGTVGAPVWSAAKRIQSLPVEQRNILTYDKIKGEGIPLRWYSQLPSYIQNDLSTAPNGKSDHYGAWRLLFLRGDRGQDGKLFRQRVSVLGDFVHSTPVYVGKSPSLWPDVVPFPTGPGKQFSDFKKTTKTRVPAVYASANDGMLHGFNAGNGTELFGYMPSAIISSSHNAGLHYLTDPNYEHIYYVDNTPAVEDVYTATPDNATKKWRTVLLGSLGAGGKGIFALDITQPVAVRESNAKNTVLWEFTSENDADLGYTFSTPVIGRLNNGRWAAIFGNGYNDAGSGRAKLFIVYLDGGNNGQWIKGKDYEVIDTVEGNTNNRNGLSTPAAVDIDGNYTIDRVYAGDLFGNLWAFDLSSSDSHQWRSVYGRKNPKPLFKAGKSQPITAKPMVAKNVNVADTGSNEPNFLVLFGTGQFLTQADKKDSTRQAFYGVWDAGIGGLSEKYLVEQTILPLSTSTARVMSDKTVAYATEKRGKKGWYISLSRGERVTTSPRVRNNIVVFTTMKPDEATQCSMGGSGWVMAVKLNNGGEPSGNQPIIDVNGDKTLDSTDTVQGHIVSGVKIADGLPNQLSLRGEYAFVPTSSGNVTSLKVLYQPTLKGHLSWQELSGFRNASHAIAQANHSESHSENK